MSTTTLDMFPEELLERILSLCVSSPPFPPARPHWHCPQLPTRSQTLPSILSSSLNSGPRTRLAPLLVSRRFNRIATPLFYHTILIRSPAHADALACTLHASQQGRTHNSNLAKSVRHLVLMGAWERAAPILLLCKALRTLDLTMTADGDGDVLLRTIPDLHYVQHLILRKAQNVYLTQPHPRAVIAAVAKGISRWTSLETVYIAFRLSDDSLTSSLASLTSAADALHASVAQLSAATDAFTNVMASRYGINPSHHLHHHWSSSSSTTPFPSLQSPIISPLPPNAGPSTLLAHALATAPSPKLHTLVTQLPAVWNTVLLTIVQGNRSLRRVVLVDGNTSRNDYGYNKFGFSHNNNLFGDEEDQSCDSPSSSLSPPSHTGRTRGDSTSVYGCRQPVLAFGATSSLFLMEARKHARLAELIRAGATSMGGMGAGGPRMRAYTMAR